MSEQSKLVNQEQHEEIKKGEKSWRDAYSNFKFTYGQMIEIELGHKRGVDVSIYANPEFTSAQMSEIREGLEEGLDVSRYAFPWLDYHIMKDIRTHMPKDPTQDTISDCTMVAKQDALSDCIARLGDD